MAMVRALTLTLGLALSVDCRAAGLGDSVTPVDLAIPSDWAAGRRRDDGRFHRRLRSNSATATTRVFFDGVQYVYTSRRCFPRPTQLRSSTPSSRQRVHWARGLALLRRVRGRARAATQPTFTSSASTGGWCGSRCSAARSAQWNAFEPITFFFASTLPPRSRTTACSRAPRGWSSARRRVSRRCPNRVRSRSSGRAWSPSTRRSGRVAASRCSLGASTREGRSLTSRRIHYRPTPVAPASRRSDSRSRLFVLRRPDAVLRRSMFSFRTHGT